MTLIINPSFNLITVLWLYETHYVFVCVGGGFPSDVHENIMWFVSKTEALCVGGRYVSIHIVYCYSGNMKTFRKWILWVGDFSCFILGHSNLIFCFSSKESFKNQCERVV